jgi:hypothetical protein
LVWFLWGYLILMTWSQVLWVNSSHDFGRLTRVIFFCLFYMRFILVLWRGHEFDRLTRVNSSRFFYFFFNVIFEYLVDWELSFIICFDLLFRGLSWSHDLGYGFGKLTRIYTSTFFHPSYFNWVFLISSFIIRLIENCVS